MARDITEIVNKTLDSLAFPEHAWFTTFWQPATAKIEDIDKEPVPLDALSKAFDKINNGQLDENSLGKEPLLKIKFTLINAFWQYDTVEAREALYYALKNALNEIKESKRQIPNADNVFTSPLQKNEDGEPLLLNTTALTLNARQQELQRQFPAIIENTLSLLEEFKQSNFKLLKTGVTARSVSRGICSTLSNHYVTIFIYQHLLYFAPESAQEKSVKEAAATLPFLSTDLETLNQSEKRLELIVTELNTPLVGLLLKTLHHLDDYPQPLRALVKTIAYSSLFALVLTVSPLYLSKFVCETVFNLLSTALIVITNGLSSQVSDWFYHQRAQDYLLASGSLSARYEDATQNPDSPHRSINDTATSTAKYFANEPSLTSLYYLFKATFGGPWWLNEGDEEPLANEDLFTPMPMREIARDPSFLEKCGIVAGKTLQGVLFSAAMLLLAPVLALHKIIDLTTTIYGYMLYLPGTALLVALNTPLYVAKGVAYTGNSVASLFKSSDANEEGNQHQALIQGSATKEPTLGTGMA